MLVEMYERNTAWWFMDENGLEWSVAMGGANPQEAKNDENNLKVVKKLKKEGFSTDEIVELFKEKIL
jgi:hypothetical protein